MVLGVPCVAQFDAFDDGNAEGWTVLDVLAEVGAPPSTITFPEGNQIRLQSAPSPNPEAVGPSRIGLFHGSTSYTAVTTLIDIVAWDPALEQDIGLIARGTTLGLGTTGGYALTLDTDESAAYLSRLDNEANATLASGPVVIEPGKTYRFRLTAIGNQISAGIANAAIPDEELVILEAEDDGYPEGVSGFFNNAGTAAGSTDATYDRYLAFDPSGPIDRPQVVSWQVDDTETLTLDYQVSLQGGGRYVLETSEDLRDWAVIAQGSVPLGFTDGQFAVLVGAPGKGFYRVAPAPPLFREDFERDADGWTTEVFAGDTTWEWGTPMAPDLDAAHSGGKAYATLLGQSYTDGANVALRSPLIDLTDKARATLSFWYHVDVTEGQEGVQVSFLSESGATLASIDEILWTRTDGWTFYQTPILEELLGQQVRLEWLFRSDNEAPNGAGFFLDDIVLD